ncbi:glyoxylate/hydroxypyruvate reductase A [Acuticoccus sediminis]|uniref:Glyoxylate/hydroxypyruvate reductase A n=1 Tax=Acuticoccus sediminis TaxID=2184697 RepID=A0A8B2NM23_9HYPH|nr:glyoxylate/hydroxypyruvate reductase A [Acuticoccus sediminis]RAH97414.1 glyoxylate/hydroxypyruvate reductase A [Acuticoccus sediminis]
MTFTIPLVARGNVDAWTAALSTAMPEARIVPFADTTEAERASAVVAIAANPDPAELAQLPNLVWVQSLWAGVERMVAELPRGLTVVRLVDPQLAETMAEAVLAFTLYLFREVPHYRRAQEARRWDPLLLRLPDEMPVGILGLGNLGRAAARRLMAQGFPVLGWNRTSRPMEGVETFWGADGLDAMLERTKVAVVLLPLTPETRGLVDAAALARLPEGASLINFARGPIVDTGALIAALDTGRLSHAVLDVFDEEPLPAESPLWSHPGITVLPHVSAPTHRATAAAIVATNIRAFRESGTIPEAVDRMRGY